ncbi:MAG: DUF4288 domain-containing protein [Chloroflexi bacterium]|nr:DUF4288 domain-containing protein [Chloroflexota bacterium]MCC6896830.1 DUF4288 domain-containing protein [Anaerolineae bacterium]
MSSKTPTSKTSKKQWYAATLIIRSRVEDQTGPYSCDEQVRLIHARSDDKAYKKAYKLGKAAETVRLNADGDMVYVEFVGLADLSQIEGGLTDGVQVKGRSFVHSAPQILALMKEELALFSQPQKEWRLEDEAAAVEDEA